MRKYLPALLLVLTLLLAGSEDSHVYAVTEAVPPEVAFFVKAPYLLYPNNNTSMTVLWQTGRTPDYCTIEWGTTSDYGSGARVTERNSDHQFSYTITGLSPDTKVHYKVRIDGKEYESHFYTAPHGSATSLSFYAYGDTRNPLDEVHLPPEQHDEVLAAILDDMALLPHKRQTFIAHSGDLNMFGLSDKIWNDDFFHRDYGTMVTHLVKFLSMFPVMIAIGNHEAYHYMDLSFTVDHEEAGKLLRKYFPYRYLAERERSYYSFDYGPVHFTVLDQYTLLDGVSDQDYVWEAQNETGQFKWMVHDLQNTTKPWKIVMFHEPAWTAKKEMGFSGNNQDMRDYYSPIFEQEGVKVVIQGHVHYYSRCESGGIQYLTLGGGGAELTDEVETDAPGYVAGKSHAYHFARFDIVDDQRMDVSIIDKDGAVIDSFSVEQ